MRTASQATADRNLLYGILAVQMDFVSPDELVAAMNAWVLNKAEPLGVHLCAAGVLSPETHALIHALVEKHIEQHGGQVERSLAAISSVEPLRQGLAQIADADVQKTLAAAAAPTPGGDRHATLVTPTPRSQPASQRFQVLRPHALGGLGKVSVARDAELNREVALKELQDRHADNPDSRARFLQEAEITGGLEHPGVVPIYGLGQFADGRPFYAMRFIRGDSLAQAIDRYHRRSDEQGRVADALQLRRLLARLIDVCNAVAYAHSRGVLHRDLKPGNIMLGQYGETLVVDWGLAKPLRRAGTEPASPAVDATQPASSEPALTPQSGSGSAPTQMGAAVGTPAYMSPEQAAGRLDQLGPTTDVYSLGATLYVLLTGHAPQEDEDLGIVLARVQRGEFPTPRSIDPAIPRALEAICLRAMALDPSERYVTPRLLAEDVESWLADEPVAAYPESLAARGYRWVRKHRTLVASGAAAAGVVMAALLATNVWLQAANEREREAKNAALAAQQNAEIARAEAERQTARNRDLLDLARTALERYETLSRSEELSRYGMERFRSSFLEAALEFYAALARQAGESETARAERASAIHRLGSAYWQLGRMDDAKQAFEDALANYQKLEREFPRNPAYITGAATALAALGELLTNARQSMAAAEPLAAAERRLEAIQEDDGGDVDLTARRAYVAGLQGERLRQVGRMEEAGAAFNRSVDLLRSIDVTKLDAAKRREMLYRLGRGLGQLGALETHTLWQFKSARQHFDESIAIMRQLYDEDRRVSDFGFSLAQVLRNSGYLHAREFSHDDATAAYEEALAALSAVEDTAPDIPHYRQEMAEIHAALGGLHHASERGNTTAEGLAHNEQAAAIGRQLVERFPEQADRKLALARYLSSLGGGYLLRNRSDEAYQCFSEATQLLAEIGADAEENIDTLRTLGEMQLAIAQQLSEAGRTAEALTMLDTAESSATKLTRLAPRYGEAYLTLANIVMARADCYFDMNRLVEAMVQYDRIAELNAKLFELSEAPWMRSTAQSVSTLAKTVRWGHLLQVREGFYRNLADMQQFDLVREQMKLLPEVTKAPADHYLAAQTLAYAASKAQNAPGGAGSDAAAAVESLSAAAVSQLDSAWRKGHIKRSGGLAAFLSTTRTLKDLQADENFQILHGRDDFNGLIDKIRTGEPAAAAAEDNSTVQPPR